MTEVMAQVLESFSVHAPQQAKLIIKNHPLDPGLHHHRRTITALATRFDVLTRGKVVLSKQRDDMPKNGLLAFYRTALEEADQANKNTGFLQ